MTDIDLSPILVTDKFLQPGGFFWGNANFRIKTLLGSCVALTLWHPTLKIGGMCHIMLPEKASDTRSIIDLNGKYAEDAVLLFLQEIKKTNKDISEFHGKLFGGSNMFTVQERIKNIEIMQDKSSSDYLLRRNINEIGLKNIAKIKSLLSEYKFNIISESVGGITHRKIFFNIWNGEVWMDMKEADRIKSEN